MKGPIAAGVGVFVVILGMVLWMTCVPPYNKPIYETVENNQTAFLIPLEGDIKNQTHFFSVD